MSDTSVAFAGSGFDTVRLRFRRQEGAYYQAKAHHAVLHARGELRRTVNGITVGAYPDGLVTVEGRLAALLYGEDDHRLLGADDFVHAPEAAADLFGLDLGAAPVGVGRADLASELRFTHGEEGLEFLRALSFVDIPWLKVGTEGGKRDRLETVYHRNMRGRSVSLRCYDKGVESEMCASGMWLRLERQRRWRKDQEGTVHDVIGRGLAEAFVGRKLRAVVAGEDAVTVCDPPAAAAPPARALHAGSDNGRRAPPARRVRLVRIRGAQAANGAAARCRAPSTRPRAEPARGWAGDGPGRRVPAGVRRSMGGLMTRYVLRAGQLAGSP